MSGTLIREYGTECSTQPLLSIVVPIGPMVDRLSTLMNWVVEVQDRSVQVILVVDEKFDGTLPQLVKKIEAADIRQELLVLNAVCNGPGKARNLGITQVRGKWLAFWDSDDIPSIAETFNAISRVDEKVDAIVCRYSIHDYAGLVASPKLSNYNVALNPGIWRFIFKCESFPELRFPDLRLGEDQVFLIHSKVFSKNFAFHSSINYQYVQSGQNQLSKEKGNLQDLLSALEILTGIYQSGAVGNKVAKHFFSIIFLRLTLTSLRYNLTRTLFYLIKNPIKGVFLIKSLPSFFIFWLRK